MFSFGFYFGLEVLCLILIVEKDKNKVLKFDIMCFPYFEISAALY